MTQPTQSFVVVEEINSNSGESRAINDFPLSNTVKDLKIAIARATGQVSEWASIMTFFVGEEMEDNARPLSSYNVHNGDTIYFARSVEPPPPYDLKGAVAPPSEKLPVTAPSAVQKPAAASAVRIKTVFFKNLEGRSMTLEDLPVTMTISQVKAKLAAEKNMENDDTLRFIWGGKNLIDERTLMDYGIGNNSTIEIVWRLHGGGW